jgi:hypothetical protein
MPSAIVDCRGNAAAGIDTEQVRMPIMIDVGRKKRDAIGTGAHWRNVTDEMVRHKSP